MKYPAPLQFRSSVSESGHWCSSGYSAAHEKVLWAGEKIPWIAIDLFGFTARTSVISIPREPVKRENASENFDFCRHWSTDYQWSENLPHPIHDIPDAEKLLMHCHRIRHSDLFIMDKAYDSEEIHKLIRDTLKSCSLIPFWNRRRKRLFRYYRKRIARSFHQENIIWEISSKPCSESWKEYSGNPSKIGNTTP
jgi:hypothetical protein